MKKLLMVVLCVSILSPTFAFAEKGGNDRKENKARQEKVTPTLPVVASPYAPIVTPIFPTTPFVNIPTVKHYEDGEREERKSPKIENKRKKMNYYFCVTATGYNVVPVDAYKSMNSANSLGSDCVKLPSNIAKKLQANMTATTTPPVVVADTIAPTASLLNVSAITTNSATVSWTTNEIANGTVYFSSSTPVNTATATTLTSAALTTTHSFNLTGLIAGVTYYYIVKSADAANNTTTTIEQSFTVPTVLDITAPIISGIMNSNVSSSTATVSWTTSELATSKLYYGTNTPLTAFVYNPTLSLVHSVNLSGLATSTAYQLIIESADSANNTATTTASLFTTI